VTRAPDDVFADVLDELRGSYEVLETARLDRYHDDHLAVVARPRTTD
jgi:fibrillarin-like pre-rRNA processing protein